MLTLDDKTVSYIQTITDAAAKGTVSVDGMKVIGLLMRGWELYAAKQQVYIDAPKLLRAGR